jgi:1-acyl-sn-glycerol-3-phosphate acyltransferase
VLVSNHISHFDPVVLSVVFHRLIDWMTTEEFYTHSLSGVWLRALNTFPVDRSRPDRRALRLAIERLRAGRVVGVFPEAGIRAGPVSVIGGGAPKSGAVALARLAEAPIIPCLIFGTDRLYRRQSWIPFGRRVPVWVTIGKPFSPPDKSERRDDSVLAGALRQLAAETIARFNLQPDDLPATPQHRKGRDRQRPNE